MKNKMPRKALRALLAVLVAGCLCGIGCASASQTDWRALSIGVPLGWSADHFLTAQGLQVYRYDIPSQGVIAMQFGYIDALADKAEEYPEVIFSHATGYKSNETNFNNYFGRIYQARYLAGVAAGLKSLEEGNNSIGYVSAYGTQYAETCSGINGFTMGVLSVNPEATVYVKELGAWADEQNEYAFAEELINTYNCCVIAQHCDSAQPQLAAANAGVYGCGYNSDMTADAPDAHLTAPIWNWNVYYQKAIETAMNNSADQFVTAMGGPAYYAGLAEGFVDISPLTENCAAGTQAAVDAVRELIVSGQWDVFSGVKLHVTVNEDGTASVEQEDAPLMTNDGTEIVAAGGPSVEDAVITGENQLLR